ncbi:MAG: hypothetical protein ABJD97_01235 [Betaproteobacteria bacterium]
MPDLPQPGLLRRLAHRVNTVFWFTVALPTVLAALYFGVLASDVYLSESRFVVRSPQRTTTGTSGLGSLLSFAGISSSHDDSYTVTSYVVSRSALAELDSQLDLRKVYGGNRLDIFDRFPGFAENDSIESLYSYYQKHVDIQYDPVGEIATMTIRAHDAKSSRDLNEHLLQMSERLVNNLNDRSRHDLIDVASREVTEAETRAQKTALALSTFRSKGAIFDPVHESGSGLDVVARLKDDLRVTLSQIQRLEALSPANPQLPSLRSQASQLRDSIASETSNITGEKSSLATKTTTFDRLMLEKSLAEKELANAVESLKAARDDASRKQLYLERLVEPNLPDYPLEPRRVRGTLTVFVLGLIAWGVISLLIAGVREHSA